MKYVVATSSQRHLDSCREFLGVRDGLELRLGSVSETGSDCDAALLSWALAHDRYGGSPTPGFAQVLVNSRSDGAPRLILATPPAPLGAASNAPSDAEVEAFVIRALRSSIAAYSDTGYGSSDSKVLIHLEAAGIDRTDLIPTLSAIADLLGGEEGQSRTVL
jgi:hypothetical protein